MLNFFILIHCLVDTLLLRTPINSISTSIHDNTSDPTVFRHNVQLLSSTTVCYVEVQHGSRQFINVERSSRSISVFSNASHYACALNTTSISTPGFRKAHVRACLYFISHILWLRSVIHCTSTANSISSLLFEC